MSHRVRGRLVAAVALVAALGVGGCGLGAGTGTKNVNVTVTENFGAVRLGAIQEPTVVGSETVMRLLERHFRVATRYGGGFVQSINGVSGGARRDWFFYVNGVQGSFGAALTKVHAGDHITWDFHDWRKAQSVPAIVGAFPEPFIHGISGKRYPTTLECGTAVSSACRTVSAALGKVGVPAATQFFGGGSGSDSLNVLVASWSQLRQTLVADLVEHGPGSSGIYARFSRDGRHLELLDPTGAVLRTLGAGAGLVAATADNSGTPTWIVTGVDAAGVRAAAALVSPARLGRHFAVATAPGLGEAALPLEPAR